jgi:hypothetical protein
LFEPEDVGPRLRIGFIEAGWQQANHIFLASFCGGLRTLGLVDPYWDLAATEKTEFNDPDWTVGIKLGRDLNRVAVGYGGRANPGDVEQLLLNTATQGSASMLPRRET